MASLVIKIPEQELDLIIKDYTSGMSVLKIAAKYPYSYMVISREIKDKNIPIRGNDFYSRKYECDEIFFNEIDTEEKAYWLGFILADGFLVKQRKHETSPSFGISIVDKEHLEKFKKNINTTYPVKKYATTGGYKIGVEYYRILIKSKKLVGKLISLGVDYQKTGKVKYPETMKGHFYERDFVRGYFYGNGSLRGSTQKLKSAQNKTYYKTTINGTFEFLSYLKDQLFVGYGLPYLTQRHPDKDNNNFDLEFNTINDMKEVLPYLYEGSNIYLDRKYEKYEDFKKGFMSEEE